MPAYMAPIKASESRIINPQIHTTQLTLSARGPGKWSSACNPVSPVAIV